MKEYYLLLITNDLIRTTYLSNTHLVLGGTLGKLDEFTKDYENPQDLANEINTTSVPIYFQEAVIISKDNLIAIQERKTTYPKKVEPVLFHEDKKFITQLSTGYADKLIKEYRDFLWNHKNEIKNSLIKYVKMGVKIDEQIYLEQLNKVFYAYYQDITYKKLRDTYFQLKSQRKKYMKIRSNE